MAHKTRINGTAYDLTGGKARINGTGYEVKKGRTRVGGAWYDITLETLFGSLAVGESVFLNVDETPTEFIVVHQGLPSSDYDASCDGTWLMAKDIYSLQKWSYSSSNSYSGSNVNTYLNGTFLGLLNQDVKEVKIPFSAGRPNFTIYTGSNGLSCKVFLLSANEVGFTTEDNSYVPMDSAKLDYFEHGSDGDERRIAYYQGSARSWFTRSPYTNGSLNVIDMTYRGAFSMGSYSNTSGIRPTFIVDSDSPVPEI